jgi:hypothetical protein
MSNNYHQEHPSDLSKSIAAEFVRQLLKSSSNQYRSLLDDKDGLGGS